MWTEITLKVLRTNPTSGKRTIEVANNFDLIEDWYEKQGKDYAEEIRDYRKNTAGQHTFKAGGGYDFIGADLLGGEPDGLAKREFEKQYDAVFVVK